VNILIRTETDADHRAVERVNELAFEQEGEARLVAALRSPACLSLVAELDGKIVGHVFFTPVTVEGADLDGPIALGPMAVTPEHQRQGIGSELVRAGLDVCRAAAVPAVFVLGHPGYYPRFGFAPASPVGFDCEWDVPPGVFQVIELDAGALHGLGGLVRYAPEFSQLG
jgi:putative acetyltransferase